MALASWPASLPRGDRALVQGYQEQWDGGVIRSEMETGPARLRRRTTAVAQPLSVTFAMDSDQVDTFKTFFLTTLSGGTEPFYFRRPREGQTEIARFRAPPQITPMGSGELWQVSFTVEIMP